MYDVSNGNMLFYIYHGGDFVDLGSYNDSNVCPVNSIT